MTDERNGGAMPPGSGPPPVPPLAPHPPPVAPQPAAPRQPPPLPPTATPRPTSFWMAMVVLAFAAGVGVTLLFLWLTGPIGSSRAPAERGSGVAKANGSPGASVNAGSPVIAPPPPTPPPARTGFAPSAALLEGTWGPDCPGSRSQSATFYEDGTMEAEGDTGSWSLNGYEVTLNGERDTTIVRWEMLGNDSARVSRPGGAPRIVNRCS